MGHAIVSNLERQDITMPTLSTRVAIIGAGPYGLSLAAHLSTRRIEYRIFGTPMQVWRQHMPAGMYLKSEWFASNLSAPGHHYALAEYCAAQRIEYTKPISLTTFTSYGLWFQQQAVAQLEDVAVVALRQRDGAFELELATGERLWAERVVVSVGVSHFAYVPEQLAVLPGELVTHTSSHSDLTVFAGRDVTVIGGGQSALETATLLHEQGASVRLLVRKPWLKWNPTPTPGPQSLVTRLRYPASGLGAGRRNWIYEHLPSGIHYLPEATRVRLVRQELGPAGSWWLKKRMSGRFPVLTGCEIQDATADKSGARLRYSQQEAGNEEVHELYTDHVIAGTGYHADVDRLSFVDGGLRAQIKQVDGAPALSRHFESSVPGLYFTGLAAANSFGPLLRFVLGADYTVRSIAGHLAQKTGTTAQTGSVTATRAEEQAVPITRGR